MLTPGAWGGVESVGSECRRQAPRGSTGAETRAGGVGAGWVEDQRKSEAGVRVLGTTQLPRLLPRFVCQVVASSPSGTSVLPGIAAVTSAGANPASKEILVQGVVVGRWTVQK